MVGVSLKYHSHHDVFIVGCAVYGVVMVTCVGMLVNRRHPRIHRLLPRLLALSQLMAFLWWLCFSGNEALADLWSNMGLSCWRWQMGVRLVSFTGFMAVMISRSVLAHSRWLSISFEKYSKKLLIMNVSLFFLCFTIVGALSVQTNDSDKCTLATSRSVIIFCYEALLLFALGLSSTLLTRTIYLDTRTDYATLHPKAYNALVDLAGVTLIFVMYPIVYAGGHRDSKREQDNVFTMMTALVIPVCMFWFQFIPAVFGYGLQLPEMPLVPDQVFDHSTGAFTSNVAFLPKLRRVIEDDQNIKKDGNQREPGSPIPVHDTERLFDLIIQGEVDECRHFLFERGIELVNVPGPNGETALHVAVGHPSLSKNTRLEMVDLLVDMKASLGAQDNEGRTPLHLVASLSDPHLLCLMVQSAMKSAKFGEAGKSHMTKLINVIANDGSTALHIATQLEDMGTLTTLLGLGADPAICSPPPPAVKPEDWDTSYEVQVGEITHGKGAFIIACEIGSLAVVQQMLTYSPKGCDIEQLSPYGMTPLMTVCYLRHTKLAMYLLKQNANVWHTMPTGRSSRCLSVLHCCAIGGDPSTLHAVIKVLVGGYQTPMVGGTDTDTLERCSYSESDLSTATPVVGNVPLSFPDPVPVPVQNHSIDSKSPSYTAQLLDRSLQLCEQYRNDSLPRVGNMYLTSLPSSSLLPSYSEGAGLSGVTDDIRAAITILATRGELEPTEAEGSLLDALEEVWEVTINCSVEEYVETQLNKSMNMERVHAIECAAKAALMDTTFPFLLEVLQQDQYQWNGENFESPLTEPKAKQLALEIRRKVVNPKITVENACMHEIRLCEQVRGLPEDEREKILRALDVVCRAAGSTSSPKGKPPPASPVRPPSTPQMNHRLRSFSGASEYTHDSPEHYPKDIDCLNEVDRIPINLYRYINRPDYWGRSALHWAVLRRHVGVIYLLVALGASTSLKDRKSRRRKDILGLTPLQYADKHFAKGSSGAVSAINEAQSLKASHVQKSASLGRR